MKLLYGARMCRYDMLHAIDMLVSPLSTWTIVQDRQLHKLMCYVHRTLDWAQYGWIGDSANDVVICLFADTYFAGDPQSNTSTSGVHLCPIGPSSSFPLEG